MSFPLKEKHVYDLPSPDDGARILVARLWPRGLSKSAAATLWLKEVAPSDALRKWFAHDPARWAEFQRRYHAELDARQEALEPPRATMREGATTLLYAARDPERNNARALGLYLRGLPAADPASREPLERAAVKDRARRDG